MQILSAEIGNVDAATIAVLFSEPVAANNFADGWIVRVNGAQVAISAASLQADRVTLYLTIPACASTDVITLQYVVPIEQTSTEARMNILDSWTPPDWRK